MISSTAYPEFDYSSGFKSLIDSEIQLEMKKD